MPWHRGRGAHIDYYDDKCYNRRVNTSTLTPLQRGLVALLAATSVACVAVIIHYIVEEVTQGIFNPGHFFSYFTIQVGLLFAIVNLAYVAMKPWQTRSTHRTRVGWLAAIERARYCIMIYGIIIVPVYWFFVTNPSEWALDWWSVIHLAMPIVGVLTWFTLPYSTMPTLRWTYWPLGYVALFAGWTFLHGNIATDHWFPYDFFDFVHHGWAYVGGWTVALFGCVLALSFVLCLATLNRAGRISH